MQDNIQAEEKLRLVNVARERFFENGFSKVTVDEIASDLRMSKKTVYKFFPTKEDLLRGVIRSMMLFVENRLTKIVASDDPFETKMTNVMLLVGGMVRRVRPQFMLDLKRSAPHLWEEMEQFRREKIFTKIRLIFQQAKEEGVLKPDVDVDIFFLTFLHSMQGIMNPQTLTEHSFSADDAFKGVLRLLFQGALTPAASERFQTLHEALTPSTATRSL
jgi:AcrR family transcriptional regulator